MIYTRLIIPIFPNQALHDGHRAGSITPAEEGIVVEMVISVNACVVSPVLRGAIRIKKEGGTSEKERVSQVNNDITDTAPFTRYEVGGSKYKDTAM